MKKEKRWDAVCALCAGLLNGMLGTGGGIPLWFAALRRGDRRRAFATGAFGVLMLSTVSLFTGGGIGEGIALLHPAAPFFALLGGACGALLLGRIPMGVLKWIFALLLIGSGIYTLWQAIAGLLAG